MAVMNIHFTDWNFDKSCNFAFCLDNSYNQNWRWKFYCIIIQWAHILKRLIGRVVWHWWLYLIHSHLCYAERMMSQTTNLAPSGLPDMFVFVLEYAAGKCDTDSDIHMLVHRTDRYKPHVISPCSLKLLL